jgi:TolB protein
VTSGSGLDIDGYLVTVDGAPHTLPPNGSITIAGIGAGGHDVRLDGLAMNCAADGQAARRVSVTSGARAEVTFAVACAPMSITQLAFVRGGRIYRVNSDGTDLVQLTDGLDDADPAWSPDGRRIAFARNSGGRDAWGTELRAIYVMDTDGSHVVRRSSTGYDRAPAWSPDGRKIAFASSGYIYALSADEDGTAPVRLSYAEAFNGAPAWSPDGGKIAFVSDAAASDFVSDIYVMNADGSGITALVFFQGPWKDGITFYSQPAWSPDGRQVALAACPRGRDECSVAVVNADGSGMRTLAAAVAGAGGYAKPTWAPDGRTIAFTSVSGSVAWVRADGSGEGVIIANGHSPAWRR